MFFLLKIKLFSYTVCLFTYNMKMYAEFVYNKHVLQHEDVLMIAKLHAYGFTISTLKMVHTYLINRWHRTKINATFSTWKELLTGVASRLYTWPLLFNMYIYTMLMTPEYMHVIRILSV